MFLEQAQQELARMAMLTKQTLGFYRENKGARSLTLAELITPLVSVFSARARNKQISIETEIRENPTLVAIPGEIRQLFANLSEQQHRCGERSRPHFDSTVGRAPIQGRKRAGVRLTVCDNGPGIAPEVRKKLFEPFFTTKRDVGTGLGLWVSLNILRKHDGSIRLRSSVIAWKKLDRVLDLPSGKSGVGLKSQSVSILASIWKCKKSRFFAHHPQTERRLGPRSLRVTPPRLSDFRERILVDLLEAIEQGARMHRLYE